MKELIQDRSNFQKVIISIGIFALLAYPMSRNWIPIPNEGDLYIHGMSFTLYFLFIWYVSIITYSYFKNFDKTKFIKRIKYFFTYAGIVLSVSIFDTIYQTSPEYAVLPFVFGLPILIWKSWRV